MIRKIIRIDETRCNGCGACAGACHEGAIEIIAGKAVLTREDYCDGLGDCLPSCPVNAISFEEREALAYIKEEFPASGPENTSESLLMQWPVQLKLIPVIAPYFENADILIAADCTAYAYADFHRDFIRNRITLIGCPKLDGVNYAEKLTSVIAGNNIKSITVVRMEVPCCGGIEQAAKNALSASGKSIPCNVITISATGQILN